MHLLTRLLVAALPLVAVGCTVPASNGANAVPAEHFHPPGLPEAHHHFEDDVGNQHAKITRTPLDDAETLSVTLTDAGFEPAEVTLRDGKPVNVVVNNQTDTTHSFAVAHGPLQFGVEPGRTGTTALSIGEPGTYEAVCVIEGHTESMKIHVFDKWGG